MAQRSFPAVDVARACRAQILIRSQRIERQREQLIVAAMRPRFFGLIRRSRAQAIYYLEMQFFGPWFMVAMRNDSWALQRLLELATAQNGASEMFLSAEEAAALFPIADEPLRAAVPPMRTH